MNPVRRGIMTAAVASSLLVGGAVGATLFGAAASGAASTTTPATTTPKTSTLPSTGSAPSTPNAPSGVPSGTVPPGPPPGGAFKPNENSAHEAGESAQREAQETAGQFPTVR